MLKSKIIKALLFFLMGMYLVSTQGEATSLDKYRNIFAGRSYTFKFRSSVYNNLKDYSGNFRTPENLYIPPDMLSDEQKYDENDAYKMYENFYDVIVMDGDNRYTEIRGNCKLINNGKVFTYRHIPIYVGNVFDYKYIGGHISKRGYTHFDEIAEGENYLPERKVKFGDKMTSKNDIEDVGEPLLMKMLAVIYPISSTNVELPNYTFVSSGNLQDGSRYEDYTGDLSGRKHVVRCYFQNGELIKMAYASYPNQSARTRDDIEKYSIEIKEISNVPDKKYFSLPTQLKVVKN